MRVVFFASVFLLLLSGSSCHNCCYDSNDGKCSSSGSYGDGMKGDKISSCHEILMRNPGARNGLYKLHDHQGSEYMTYCDMKTGGGGWTLVASVHENFLQGKCTVGDKWSSEQGNNAAHPHGDGNWANTNVFGHPESASSDDYKNPGYFNMDAKNVMLWQVPNDTPLADYEKSAFMKYHTENGFLDQYGGNMYTLFKESFPLRHGEYARTSGNGPSIPITWDRGSNDLLVANQAPNVRTETTPGYIQFRAINNEKSAFALCPGAKINDNMGNVEHFCIGGTSNHLESVRFCGDFGGRDWDGYGTGIHWSSNRLMSESVVMIFYR